MKIPLANFSIQPERAINGFKTGLACLIGSLIVWSTQLHTGQWLIITIVVVMSGQLRLGGAIKKGYMRMLGTLLAAVISASTIYFLGTEHWILMLVIFLSVMLFSYISTSETDISEMGTLGGVTVVMLLINEPVTLENAGYRFVEILLGIIIALLISSLIYPIYAKNSLRKRVAQMLHKMADMYQLYLNPLTEANTENLITLEDEIAKLFITQNKLLAESKAEIFGKEIPKNLLQQIIRTERRIYRSMHLVNQSLSSLNYAQLSDHCAQVIKDFNEEVITSFKNLASITIPNKTTSKSINVDILPAKIATLSTALSDIHNSTQLVELHALQFCAKNLVMHIHALNPLLIIFTHE